ncbi:MAG: tRNA-binding protein [Dethiosulfovibrio peptidovorans]|nr:MAG: tRNA-binding protein [Dethiosulfovibrio peptidovorans]
MTISQDDFENIDMRIGKILRVEVNEKARHPAYKLWIDMGQELGVRQSSAQCTDLYSQEDLLGRLVVCVVNFPPKRIAGFKSEVLVLGANDDQGKVVLLSTERPVPPGSRLY